MFVVLVSLCWYLSFPVIKVISYFHDFFFIFASVNSFVEGYIFAYFGLDFQFGLSITEYNTLQCWSFLHTEVLESFTACLELNLH